MAAAHQRRQGRFNKSDHMYNSIHVDSVFVCTMTFYVTIDKDAYVLLAESWYKCSCLKSLKMKRDLSYITSDTRNSVSISGSQCFLDMVSGRVVQRLVAFAGGVLSISLWSQPAHAVVGLGTPVTLLTAALASAAAYAICKGVEKPPVDKDFCKGIAITADPVFSANITEISIGMSYDPTLFAFNQSLSGPLAPFGLGGTIFPLDASIGTKPIGLVDADTFSPASLLSGSTLQYINSEGFVKAVLSFEDPGIAVSDQDQNFFVFVFDSLGGPIDPEGLVTYVAPSIATDSPPPSDDSGPVCSSTTPIEDIILGGGGIPSNGDFKQTEFSCKFSVPGPLPLLGVGAALGFSRKLRKRIKSSKPPVASAID